MYDRDASRNLIGPIPAKLPVGIDFLALPFGEPMLFKIASAYEGATRHRSPPPDFGPLENRGWHPNKPGKARDMPRHRELSREEKHSIEQD